MRRASGSVGSVLFLCGSYTGVHLVIIPHKEHFCFVHFFCIGVTFHNNKLKKKKLLLAHMLTSNSSQFINSIICGEWYK